MLKERNLLAVKLISSHIILPIVLSIASYFINGEAYLFYSTSQTVLCIIFLAGYWEFIGRRFRLIFCLFIELVLITSLILKLSLAVPSHTELYLVMVFGLMQLYFLLVLVRIIFVVFEKSKSAIEILFPFKNGKFLITDGGNSKISRMMNYHYYSPVHQKHNTNCSMLFATDIVKIEVSKFKFMCASNEEYPIYGEKVYSPVNGIVLKIVNDIDDNKPYSGNYPYNTGNTIVIRQDNYYFLLGHLRKGSIWVNSGSVVKAGDLIAEAGNSGMSERPHIHIQLIQSDTENFRKGIGVSIQFKRKNLYKNRIIQV